MHMFKPIIFYLPQFHEDAIMATDGDNPAQSRTLLGRLEDGRIIISESGDHVATVAMVIKASTGVKLF